MARSPKFFNPMPSLPEFMDLKLLGKTIFGVTKKFGYFFWAIHSFGSELRKTSNHLVGAFCLDVRTPTNGFSTKPLKAIHC